MEKRTKPDPVPPQDQIANDYAPSALPIAPDGGLDATALPPPPPLPEKQFTDGVCCKGPCRHYWYFKRPAPEAVPGTFESLPVIEGETPPTELGEHHHVCLVNPGYGETQFSSDDCVLECNRWDPITPEEKIARASRRQKFNGTANED